MGIAWLRSLTSCFWGLREWWHWWKIGRWQRGDPETLPDSAQLLLDIPLATFSDATRTPCPGVWFPLEGLGFWALPWPFSPWDVRGSRQLLAALPHHVRSSSPCAGVPSTEFSVFRRPRALPAPQTPRLPLTPTGHPPCRPREEKGIFVAHST